MKGISILVATGLSLATAFVAPAPKLAAVKARSQGTLSMGLNAELTKTYPRDFKNIPIGTSYGMWWDGRGRIETIQIT
jgi:hypothetical protein